MCFFSFYLSSRNDASCANTSTKVFDTSILKLISASASTRSSLLKFNLLLSTKLFPGLSHFIPNKFIQPTSKWRLIHQSSSPAQQQAHYSCCYTSSSSWLFFYRPFVVVSILFVAFALSSPGISEQDICRLDMIVRAMSTNC